MYRGPYQVVTIEKPPFVMYDPKTRIYSGLLIDLFQEIAERLNITYTISLEKSGLYGYQDEYGNWDGIMRQLTVGRADIGLAALSLMSERLRAVDFTDPIYPSNGVSIIMQKPIPNTVLFRIRELYAKKWIQTNRAKWWENNPKRVWCYNMDEKSVGILIENIGGLFLTILFGIGISLTVMAGEYIYLKYYRERVEKYLEKRREKRLKKKNDKKENITHIEVKE